MSEQKDQDCYRAAECWNCGTRYDNENYDCYPLCPACGVLAWGEMTAAQRETAKAIADERTGKLGQSQCEIEALRSTLSALQNEAIKRAHNIKAFTEALPMRQDEIVAPHVVINSGYQAWLQAHELEGYIENMRKGQPE